MDIRLEMKDIFQYIDDRREQSLQELSKFCSFRSVQGHAEGLKQAQRFIEQKLQSLDVGYERYNSGEEPSDVLLSSNPVSGKPTLLLYNHYDVVDVAEEMQQTQFSMKEKGGRLYARGVSDNKGALLGRLLALEAIKEVKGTWPIGLTLLYDNSEETGSCTLKHLKTHRRDLFSKYMQADLCLWENGRTLPDLSPEAAFGVRASFSVKLRVRTSNDLEHGRMGAELPNAAFRLAHAIASLKDVEENILIDGFYDDVVEATPMELDILKRYPYDEKGMLRDKELTQFLLGLSGDELKKRIFFSPLLNVSGLYSGTEDGSFENIVPNEAVAGISIALVPNQTAQDIFQKLKRQLKKNGFEDVEALGTAEGFPIRTDVGSQWTKVLADAASQIYEKPLTLSITQLGGGPAHLLREVNASLPIVAACGVAALDSGHHSTNENILLDNFWNGIKYTAATVMRMAEEKV